MGTKTRYALLSVIVLISILTSGCGTAPTQSEIATECNGLPPGAVVTVGTLQKAEDVTCDGKTYDVPDWLRAAAWAEDAETTIKVGDYTVKTADIREMTTNPNQVASAAIPPKPGEGKNGVETDTLTLTMGEDFPAPACAEQMMGPYQPPSTHEYWYVQVNTEFEDSDYLVSLFYEEDVDLSGWLVQEGGPDKNGNDPQITEIVYTVRTSIDEVQFANPAGGVSWRLCAHPDAQLGAEVQQHAENIAEARSWLRVYNVGDLWMSLATGDAELKKLIKCIDPVIAGIPSCQNP